MSETDEQDRESFIADRMFEELVERAAALGREHGTDGASWVELFGETQGTWCLEMDNEGDPEWWDRYGPQTDPLSGEWADGMTPVDLVAELTEGMTYAQVVDADGLVDELCDAYETAYYDAWRDEVLRMARYQVGES